MSIEAYFQGAIGKHYRGERLLKIHKMHPLWVFSVWDDGHGEVISKGVPRDYGLHFAMAIDEYPLQFTNPDGSSVYAPDRVHAKLTAVLAAGHLLDLAGSLFRLLNSAIDSLAQDDGSEVSARIIHRLLAPFARSDVDGLLDQFRSELKHPLEEFSGEWGDGHAAASRAKERLPRYASVLASRPIGTNPLVVWGTAHVEGFFTREELAFYCRRLSADYRFDSAAQRQYAATVAAHNALRRDEPHGPTEAAERMLQICLGMPLDHEVLNAAFGPAGFTISRTNEGDAGF